MGAAPERREIPNTQSSRELEVGGEREPVVLPVRDHHFRHCRYTLQCIGQDSGKLRSQKVDIQLKVAVAIGTKYNERATRLTRSCHQIESQLPGGLAGNRQHVRKLAPVETTFRFEGACMIAERMHYLQLKSVEIIALEGRNQDIAHLFEIDSDLEFLDCAAYREIVDNDLTLLNGALRHSTQFAKLRVVQLLHSQPYPRSHDRQHKSQGASRRPQQKEAKHRKYRGDGVENDYNLTMRKPHLQQLVVNMFAIGGEDRSAADEPSQNGKQGLQDRQSERHYRNRHRHECRRFLRSRQSQRAKHEADEQAARVAQENRSGIEVEERNPRMAPASVTLIKASSHE